MVSLLMLDLDSYIRENFMAAFLVSAVWLCIHRKLFIHRKWIGVYTAAVLLVNTVRYGAMLLSIL